MGYLFWTITLTNSVLGRSVQTEIPETDYLFLAKFKLDTKICVWGGKDRNSWSCDLHQHQFCLKVFKKQPKTENAVILIYNVSC
jgi:hypothetical protein